MLRLRAGLLAVFVASLTSFAMVTAPAAAADPVPVDPRVALGYDDPLDWPSSPQEAFNRLIASIQNDPWGTEGMCGDFLANPDGSCPQNDPPFPIMEALMTKVGGTPAQVAAGEKAASKACRTAYTCVGALAAMIGLGALGTQDVWGPWVQGSTLDSPAPVLYQSVRAGAQYGCNVNGVPTGMTWEGGTISWSCTANFASGAVNIFSAVVVDLVHKTTGAWVHDTPCTPSATWHGNENITFTCNPRAGRGGNAADYEVRRIHWVEDASIYAIWGNQPWGWSKGFYWGQEIVGGTDSIESLTRCKRPDNSVYDVVTTEPASSGLTGVPACNAGDTPVYTETTRIDSAGNRYPQTSQRIDTADMANEMFPSCSGTSCIWTVKANGVPCQVGMAACVEWARDKADNTCWYGPYQLPISQCYWLERAYEDGITTPLTKPNVDGDPDTHEGPAPNLQPIPTPTTTATVTTTTAPTTTPNTDPTTRPSPTSSSSSTSTSSPSSSPTPSPPPDTSGAPNPSDPEGQKCFPSGWASFNPVQWVLMPIRCALEPDPVKTRTKVDTLRTELEEVGPGPLIVAVSSVIDQAADSGGCQGPNMPFEIGGIHQDIHPFSACTEPMATAATYVKALATVVIVIGGGLAMTRAIASGFGFSFTMGKGTNDGD